MLLALLGQCGYNRRIRAAGPLISALISALAKGTPSCHELLQLVDSIPHALSRETVKRSDLAGHAGYGYGASHSRYYWGFRLYLIATAGGMPVLWPLANPKIGEREVTRSVWERGHQLIHDGPPRTPGGLAPPFYSKSASTH